MIQIEHTCNIVKNFKWPETRQFATVKQIQVVVGAGLKPPTTGLQVWRSDHSLTLQPKRGTAAFNTLEATKHTFNHLPSTVPLTVELTYLIACADGLWESSAKRSLKLSRAISTDLKQTSLIIVHPDFFSLYFTRDYNCTVCGHQTPIKIINNINFCNRSFSAFW